MTALKVLIKWWDEDFPNWDKSSEGFSIIEKAKELLEKEEKQIIEAYEIGYDDGFHSDLSLSEYEKCEKIGEIYFKETYEQ